MDNDIFKPTLRDEGVRQSRTYDISKLFYVAFFGGTIPITVLGARNANWLGLKKSFINSFYVLGVLILLAKITAVALYMGGLLQISSRGIRLGVRVADVLLYILMYFIMKSKFNMHLLGGGEYEPILKDSIKWILIGILLEIVLFLAGGYIGAYVLK